MDNPICVNIKSYFNLWNSSWSWWDSGKIKLTKHFIILCHFSFALKYSNRDCSLIIRCCWVNLAFFCWNCCISNIKKRYLYIIFVITPPKVSIPKDKGVTSNKSKSLTSPFNTPPYIAAPMATASSGLTDLFGTFPKNFYTNSWT